MQMDLCEDVLLDIGIIGYGLASQLLGNTLPSNWLARLK